ncbi:DUF6531 domain-containing protein, partial [Nonomuraea sp. NPDC004297]
MVRLVVVWSVVGVRPKTCRINVLNAVKTVVAGLVLLLPGLLQFSVQPVAADTRDSGVPRTDVGVATPRQQWGSAGVLPALVDASVTRADGPAADPEKMRAELPEGALLPDRSFAGERPAPAGEPPRGLIPRDALERKAAYRAAAQEAARASGAADPPAIWSSHPIDGLQIDSLTPQLRVEAYGSGTSAWWDIERQYKVCELTESGGTGTCTTSAWLSWTVPYWTVPAAANLQWGKSYEWEVQVRDPATGATSYRDGMYFTTGVRQPAVSSLLATRGVDGQEFHQVAGNYTSAVTDASLAAAGALPLSVVRSYNSLDRRAKAMFGAGWSTRFDMRIDSEGGTPESLLVTYPDGRGPRRAHRTT